MTQRDLVKKLHQDVLGYLVNLRRPRLRNVSHDIGNILGEMAISDFIEFTEGLEAIIEEVIYNEDIYFNDDDHSDGDKQCNP